MQNTLEKTDYVKTWLSRLDLYSSQVEGAEPAAVHSLRAQGRAVFADQGFPNTGHEEWKYTSVLPLLKREYTGAPFRPARSLDPSVLTPYLVPGLESWLLVFVNGHFDASLSHTEGMPATLTAGSLSAALQNGHPGTRHFGQHLAPTDSPFAALNQSAWTDGAYVHIAAGARLTQPITLLHLTDAGTGPLHTQSRLLIVAEDRSEAQITLLRGSLGGHATLANETAEIYVGAEAHLQFTQIQNDREGASLIQFIQAVQERNSTFQADTLTLGGEIVRNNLHIRHQGQHCESWLNGLYLLTGDTHADHHTLVDHAQPNCYSNELYKGVLDGSSTGVFNGKIWVRQDAQKTNAFQSNNNLVLSEKATINTKPQLEIYADDVKCSHGATTGRLNETSLFYLRARGMGEESARALLTYAFAADVVEKLKNETLREWVSDLLKTRLGAH